MRLDLAHLAEGAVEIHGIELVDRHAVGQQREGEAGEGPVEQAARAGESLDVPEVGPALRSAVGELVLAIDQIGAERIAGDAVFAHHVRRQLVGLRRRLVDLVEQSFEHGLAVFDVAQVDEVPLEIPGLHLRLELGERDAGHGLDLDAGLRRVGVEERLSPGGFPHPAVRIDVDRAGLRARRADDRRGAEERAGAERQHSAARNSRCHLHPP